MNSDAVENEQCLSVEDVAVAVEPGPVRIPDTRL